MLTLIAPRFCYHELGMILAGDVGGTKCTLSLFARSGLDLQALCRFSTPTHGSQSIAELFDKFWPYVRQERPEIDRRGLTWVGLGIAGTVVGDQVLSNNLPWPVDRGTVAASLQLDPSRVVLLNDLVASATSLAHLESTDLHPLNSGRREERAPMALIAAGTGLGEAILFWDGERYKVSPSEAGLTDFAPRNDREFLLLQSLRHRMPRVCTEDVISGRGFQAIHQVIFPGVQHSFFDEPGVDPAVKITQQALAGTCRACEETLQIWTEAYGAEAGNMALRVLPFGGVYIAGGIALKILPKMQDGSFVRAFSDKIQLSSQLARIPIYVVMNEDAPVLGAAYEALAHASAADSTAVNIGK
jgi:glucokinase